MGKRLKIGDPIPEVSLKNQDGELISLRKLGASNPLVIYFYPKDETPGCTAEACLFRDRYDEFEDLGATVIGISSDSVSSHKKFAEKHQLNFMLLSDPKHEAEKAFGVPRNLFGMLPGRVTFIFDAQGHLIREFNSAIQPTRHIKESLNALQSD